MAAVWFKQSSRMTFHQIAPYWKGEKPAVIDRGDTE